MATEHELIADRLRSDARVAEAEALLLSALSDAQKHLADRGVLRPRPAKSKLAFGYQQLLKRLASARGGATYFPYIASGLGDGPWVELADGSVKLDFISGIGVHGLGHSHPKLLVAGLRAALQDTVMQGNLQQHLPSLHICERLLSLAQKDGAELANCLLSTSGAMANENALKIAFHHRTPADRIIALDNCFAGRTIATSQLTDRPQYRVGIPTALAVDYLPPEDPNHSQESQERSLAALDKLLRRHPGKYAALWLELVAGEGGYYAGSTEYFLKLIARVRQDDVLIIFDEVQTFGRLSQPFAFQHFGLSEFADIVTIGKITQLCATLYPDRLKPSGPLLSQTFTASSSSIEAAMVMLDELEAFDCFGSGGQNMKRFHYFSDRLQKLAQRYPGRIHGPHGCGMMVAFTPDDGSANAANNMVHALYHAGLMGFVAGGDPSRVRFLPPPGVTTQEHIDAAMELSTRCSRALNRSFAITGSFRTTFLFTNCHSEGALATEESVFTLANIGSVEKVDPSNSTTGCPPVSELKRSQSLGEVGSYSARKDFVLEIVRSVQLDDIDQLWELVAKSTYGLTTLQITKEQLSERVELSNFAVTRKTEKPNGEPYVFVMEDTNDGKLVGLCSIFSKTGGYEPFYSYRRVTETNFCKHLDRSQTVETLQLAKIHDGPTEIGSLFLAPEYRGKGRGRLLSLSRFMFMAAHPKRFADSVIAEMRGIMSNEGECPFWEAIGRHFFDMDFPQADLLSTLNKSFIEDFMPKYPIYLNLLSESVRASMGDVHPNTRPALAMLEAEGFKKTDMIDIFDGGPVVECVADQIDAVRRTKLTRVVKISSELQSASSDPGVRVILSSATDGFRAMIGEAVETDDGLMISERVAPSLRVRAGDPISAMSLYPTKARPEQTAD